MITDSDALLYTVFYILLSVCFVFPPSEFLSAGITVQHLLSGWLGSEDVQFIHYHIRRTSATLLLHSFIPLGYVIGLVYFTEEDSFEELLEDSLKWKVFVGVTVLLPLLASLVVCSWYRDHWGRHPIARNLQIYCTPRNSWYTVATDINIEFRRIDKISITTNSITKVVGTDNWIMKLTPYMVEIGHQHDVVLILMSSDQHSVSPNSPGGVQYLNIEVKSVREGLRSFNIRLNSLDFRDLQDKMSRPVQNIQNITIHQSLSDRFLEAFTEHVMRNPRYQTREELDSCTGCMQTVSNVKLQRLCDTEGQGSEACVTCYCRPMWCINCLGKWFASRQDESHPEVWLSAKCPCPTCRSKFCILDVCFIE